MRKLFFVSGAFFLFTANLKATTYYVSPSGSDSNSGTNIAQPFATPQHAVTLSALAAGDTIYLRGGVYALITEVKPSKSGTAANLCKLWAYPGEQPIFYYSNAPSGTRGLYISKDCWHVKGVEIAFARDNGVIVTGGNNLIEGCVMHDCTDDGLTIGSTSVKGHDNLILNCDSYRNYGGGDGNNGDGYSAKAGCGPNNVFRGCRAWNNSDDAWDFYDNITNSVVLQNCWAFWNGYNVFDYGGTWNGNGNGFKLGGGTTYANHYVTNCVAFGNRRKGFDHNNSRGGQTIVNCTGYSNNTVNFSFFDTPTNGTPLFHRLINNVSYGTTATALDPTVVQISNSWQIATVTAADFTSLDVSLALAPRNADYSLPTNNLFRLTAGSDLIDRGINVGLPFNGSAPDLGAFEFTATVPPQLPSWFDPAGCRMTNGGFVLKLNGFTSHGAIILYASPDLLNWTPLSTNPPATGALTLLDATPGQLQRYYRAQEQ